MTPQTAKQSIIEEMPWKRAVRNVLHTGYWISDRLNEVLKPFGISEQQLNVLFILRKHGCGVCNLSDVQEEMMHKMSNATRLVEKLRLKGLVTRQTDEGNRRKVEITCTEKGLAFLEKVESKMKERLHGYYENKLSDEEYTQLAELLDKFRK
jgi:DNA-binding MarR family transcriptional regulator